MRWVEITALMLAPSAAFWLAAKAWGILTGTAGHRWRLPRGTRDAYAPAIERLGADLRRLSLEIERLESSDAPAKMARMQAASLAYDDVLISACRALDVPSPGRRGPLGPLERLEAEAALARQGLVW